MAKPPRHPISNAAARGSAKSRCERLEHATRDTPRSRAVNPRRDAHALHRGSLAGGGGRLLPRRCFPRTRHVRRQARHRAAGGNARRVWQLGIAVAVAKLKALSIGVLDCDLLIGAFVTVLTCDKLAFAQRLEIGNDADFWALPRSCRGDGCPRDSSCKGWYVELKAQVGESGCMPCRRLDHPRHDRRIHSATPSGRRGAAARPARARCRTSIRRSCWRRRSTARRAGRDRSKRRRGRHRAAACRRRRAGREHRPQRGARGRLARRGDRHSRSTASAARGCRRSTSPPWE